MCLLKKISFVPSPVHCGFKNRTSNLPNTPSPSYCKSMRTSAGLPYCTAYYVNNDAARAHTRKHTVGCVEEVYVCLQVVSCWSTIRKQRRSHAHKHTVDHGLCRPTFFFTLSAAGVLLRKQRRSHAHKHTVDHGLCRPTCLLQVVSNGVGLLLDCLRG